MSSRTSIVTQPKRTSIFGSARARSSPTTDRGWCLQDSSISNDQLCERRELPQDRGVELGDGGMDRQRLCEYVIRRVGMHQGADDLHDLVAGYAEHRRAEESLGL